ncbi:isocitrate lyase/phosphoenolpyruvate mutase family protein [Saccharomonospora sp. NPDC046836]|uniref:isocitrate lyase/phosphoenolpyruvate mutase family protein n=1 Tax=Saccharomonospora sp. NPDC046836 TaxID=3156921 RepID=UPI0033FB3471
MHAHTRSVLSGPSALRAALETAPVIVPGCHDPLSARHAANAGAHAVFVSGGAVGRGRFNAPAVPRDGAAVYTDYVRHICASVSIPVIVDGEDGFGDPVGTCSRLAEAGAAAVIVADTPADGGPPRDMTATITRVRAELDVALVARADGLEQDPAGCRDRLHQYCDAGADLVMPLLNTVLRQPPEQLAATLTALAENTAPKLVLHSPLGRELPPPHQLPKGIAAVLVTAVALPPSPEHLATVLEHGRLPG